MLEDWNIARKDGKNTSLRSWRPFGGVYPERSRRAQDMLGAINPLRLLDQNPIDSLAALR